MYFLKNEIRKHLPDNSLPKSHKPSLIMRKRIKYTQIGSNSTKHMEVKIAKSEIDRKLSLVRDDLTTKYNMVSQMGSWDRETVPGKDCESPNKVGTLINKCTVIT